MLIVVAELGRDAEMRSLTSEDTLRNRPTHGYPTGPGECYSSTYGGAELHPVPCISIETRVPPCWRAFRSIQLGVLDRISEGRV